METELEPLENPLAAGVICGVTRIMGGNIQWICINPPHDPHYVRKGKSYPEPGNGAHPARHDGHPPKADRHWFVNRWPNRTT